MPILSDRKRGFGQSVISSMQYRSPMSDTDTEDDRRRRRILDAAQELIVRFGYDKTAVREIAESAGVSKGTIYLHFDSKRQLFEALLVREMIRFGDRWLECVEADPQGGTMGSLFRNILEAQKSSSLMEAIYRQDSRILGTYLRSDGHLLEEMYEESLHTGFVEAMQEAGTIRADLDADVLAHVLDIIDYGFASIGDVKKDVQMPPPEETIAMIGTFIDRALTPEDGGDCEAGKEAVRRLANSYRQVLREKLPS